MNMSHALTAQNNFQEALKHLRDVKTPFDANATEFKLSCFKFIIEFNAWMQRESVAANAFKHFMITSPIWYMLELPKEEWNAWIKNYASQHHHAC